MLTVITLCICPVRDVPATASGSTAFKVLPWCNFAPTRLRDGFSKLFHDRQRYLKLTPGVENSGPNSSSAASTPTVWRRELRVFVERMAHFTSAMLQAGRVCANPTTWHDHYGALPLPVHLVRE